MEVGGVPVNIVSRLNVLCVRTSSDSFIIVMILAVLFFTPNAAASDFFQPWKEKSQALVLDAYEKNPVDWELLTNNEQVAGFIAKASDGLPPPWSCVTEDETELTLCKKTFQNHWLKKQLYRSRRSIAKNLGLRWGAYHLGRPGNPIEQANHFIDFAEPEPDELLALDIEHDDPDKWISFEDAEIFVKHIKFRTGRYPVLYTNHLTAKRIAARRAEFPILSRLPLWYARYRTDIRGVFPMGHWERYALWQFSSNVNCNKKRCLYRVEGTEPDIDVNASGMTVAELKKAWPFGNLVPERQYPPNSNPELIVVKTEKRQPEASLAIRYKANLTFKNDQGKTVRLSSIAVPVSRNLSGAAGQGFANAAAVFGSTKLEGNAAVFHIADLEAEYGALIEIARKERQALKERLARRGKEYGYSNGEKSAKLSSVN